ncbi:MAG TPA: hydrogenase maturation protease [Solirubrobacteraceae bacterium]|nr:hydrogenase maturation protease [Solirubrobacteraceae bacterium]
MVIGIGNAARGDDAAGLITARRLGGLEHEGDPVALLDVWREADVAVVIDAVSSGAAPGTVYRFDATAAPLPAQLRGSSSTHALGLAEAIELGRTLGRLPRRLIVYGIEGERFEAGAELTPAVAAAVEAVAGAVGAAP